MNNNLNNNVKSKNGDKKRMMEAIKYIEQRRERLLELEREIDSIKHDKEWIKSLSTLRVYAHYGVIDEAPIKANDYRTPKIISKNN